MSLLPLVPIDLALTPHSLPFFYRAWSRVLAACPPGHTVAVGYAYERDGFIVTDERDWLWALGQHPAAASTCFLPPEVSP